MPYPVPCPCPTGRPRDLYGPQAHCVTPTIRAATRARCRRFYRPWYASDGHAFSVVAICEARDPASALCRRWRIDDDPGQKVIALDGDVGPMVET